MTPVNPYSRQWEQFKASTPEHQLTVLRSDGLYRHLRMGRPGTSMWSWSVVTWPGYLAIVGDVGSGFVFARVPDMLSFFDTSHYGDQYGDGSPYLQADYWAEKLTHACRDAARSYDPELILSQVRDHLDGLVADDDMPQTDADQLFERARWHADTENEIREWLFDTPPFCENDTWEWEYRSLDHHYLLACYAITTTVRAYHALQTSEYASVKGTG